MELRPQLLLEGLAAAMRFCETDEAYIYLREEYATSRAVLQEAIAARGLPVELVIGAGAYICGEETAMLGVDGGTARDAAAAAAVPGAVRLPRPADADQQRRDARARRADPPRRLAADSPLVCHRRRCEAGLLRGAARHHAPQADRQDAGGLTAEVGAIVPGGAASGILPPAALDAPLTREGLAEWGCGVGSAAVQVFPSTYSPRRLLAETMRFFAEESCQKCTPCRIGNRALHAVFEGERTMTRETMDEWLEAMAVTSICGLGQAAPIPVRTAFRHWPELFEKMPGT